MTPISDQGFGFWEGLDHQRCAFVGAHLTFAQQHDNRSALAISDRVQFGVQPTFGAPDMSGKTPF